MAAEEATNALYYADAVERYCSALQRKYKSPPEQQLRMYFGLRVAFAAAHTAPAVETHSSVYGPVAVTLSLVSVVAALAAIAFVHSKRGMRIGSGIIIRHKAPRTHKSGGARRRADREVLNVVEQHREANPLSADSLPALQ